VEELTGELDVIKRSAFSSSSSLSSLLLQHFLLAVL